jgi:hypothetical protein
MTGYVVEKPSATGVSSGASSAAEPSSSTSASWSEVQETTETASPTYSTSTASFSTETYFYTTRPTVRLFALPRTFSLTLLASQVNPGVYTIGTMTGYVPIPTTSTSFSTREGFSTTNIPSATPTAAPLAERDFAEVDMHLLHRRGLDFEEASEEESASGKEEYSYSTKKDGATVTYVKTTRPIVRLLAFLSLAWLADLLDVYRSTPGDTRSVPSMARMSKRPNRPNCKLGMS